MGKRKRLSADKIKEAKRDLAFAKLKNVPSSPRKMRLVADMVRGVEVLQAYHLNTLLLYCERSEMSRSHSFLK